MQKTTFVSLLNKIQVLPLATTKIKGYPETGLEKQMLIALWYLANLESMRSVANRFGISKSTTWRIIYKVCAVMLQMNYTYGIISLPNQERLNITRNHFRQKTGFHRVIGAIDGSHIPIVAPHENPASYINRKGFSSVVLQGSCNENKEFIHCYAGEVGSVHDAAVLRRSQLLQFLQCPDDSHLLGDTVYPLSTKILVPFKDNGHLNNIEKNYNVVHSKTRVIIEHDFGLLKGRWRRLKLVESKRLVGLLMACCILHNICLTANDILYDINIREEVNEEHIMQVPNSNNEDYNERVYKRQDIANLLYLRELRN